MKKLITLILTVSLVSVMSTAIFATQQSATDSSTQTTQVNAEKKVQRSEFKAQVTPLRTERKSNREENLALREQNKLLVTQLQGKIATIKLSESKLTAEQKTSLKALRLEVKSIRAEIKATAGQVKAILEANKVNLKNMDLAAVQAAFNQVFGIQDLRHQKLQAINDTLNEMIATLS
ncbi:MAG TPA: hypothetical protein VIK78_11625 [Ruminiclostridium sp.]